MISECLMCLRIKYISFLSVLLFLREGARPSFKGKKKEKECVAGHPIATWQDGIWGQARVPHSILLQCPEPLPATSVHSNVQFLSQLPGPKPNWHTHVLLFPLSLRKSSITFITKTIPTIPNNKNVEVNFKTHRNSEWRRLENSV